VGAAEERAALGPAALAIRTAAASVAAVSVVAGLAARPVVRPVARRETPLSKTPRPVFAGR
jgi:hypothetical protein